MMLEAIGQICDLTHERIRLTLAIDLGLPERRGPFRLRRMGEKLRWLKPGRTAV
ncbi:MAG: hypothetical protein QOH16_701 [Gaiellaceae bacterium]|nr:hypothetical protein [Gaiellaceae bacterium]